MQVSSDRTGPDSGGPPASGADRSDEASPAVTGAVTDQALDPSDTLNGEEVERVAEELLEGLVEAPRAGELAEATDDEMQRMADLRAKHLVMEFEAQQEAKHARLDGS
jgi:hypothetical protein